MKKAIVVILVCSVFLMCLAGCNVKYKQEQFLGKTSAEIENEYGKFDCVLMPVSEDGLYRNCRCGYTIKEPRGSSVLISKGASSSTSEYSLSGSTKR